MNPIRKGRRQHVSVKLDKKSLKSNGKTKRKTSTDDLKCVNPFEASTSRVRQPLLAFALLKIGWFNSRPRAKTAFKCQTKFWTLPVRSTNVVEFNKYQFLVLLHAIRVSAYKHHSTTRPLKHVSYAGKTWQVRFKWLSLVRQGSNSPPPWAWTTVKFPWVAGGMFKLQIDRCIKEVVF